MRWLAVSLALGLSLPALAAASKSSVVLDGATVRVRWSDGDTFSFHRGEGKSTTARLAGFNTLEKYGPVHRWGAWEPSGLFELAKRATEVAKRGRWACVAKGKADGYGRVLVDCPDLARTLVAEGLAMVFAVDEPADAALLAVQHDAQRAKAGMWSKGTPKTIVTSVHSKAEGKGYLRVVDTATGVSKVVPHDVEIPTCEAVCSGEGADRSCLVYVPFERRYGNRPECLVR